MKIDCSEHAIKIYEPHMNAQHMGQLSFWGFQKNRNNNTLEVVSDNLPPILQKVVNYFDKEEVRYDLSESARALYDEYQKNYFLFLDLKHRLSDFKAGKLDKKSYVEFVNFQQTHLTRTLKDHQYKAAYHLYLAKNGANFSVPGSGKTSVVLSVYEKLRFEGKVDTLFVIGPPSSFGPWKNEFKSTLGRAPKYQILAGGNKNERKLEYYPDSSTKSELYLTTFQTVLKDQEEVKKLFDSKHIKAFLVVDEAHYIKQLDGNWAKAILKISESAIVRAALTGTPIPKSYTDLFNLFDFLWPENNPIDSVAKSKIFMYEKQKNNSEVKSILDQSVGPLFYRVRKADLGLTKPIFHEPILVDMNPYERKIYSAIENKIRENTTTDDFYDIELVLKLRRGRLIRLRQAVSYVGLLKRPVEEYAESLYDEKSDIGKYISTYDNLEVPAKVERLISMIENFSNTKQKVLIWSNFIGTLELLNKKLTDKGFYNKLIYGKTPIEQTTVEEEETRENIRNEFVDPKSGLDILIANPAACAESISLHTTCHQAIYYDLSYNCAQYLQSLDRIHRVGGSEKVFANYYFLQYKDTFEADIKDSLEQKAEKMYYLIDQDYSIYNLDLFEDDELSAYERLFKSKTKI